MNKIKVLIVDDSIFMRKALESLLSGEFNVASAPSFVSELTIITGVGLFFIINSKAVIPSIVGISISIVITSG